MRVTRQAIQRSAAYAALSFLERMLLASLDLDARRRAAVALERRFAIHLEHAQIVGAERRKPT